MRLLRAWLFVIPVLVLSVAGVSSHHGPTHTGSQRRFFRRLVRADGTELLRAADQRLNAIEEERRQRARQRNQQK